MRPDSARNPYLSIQMAEFSRTGAILPTMTLPAREFLQMLLALCVWLAATILVRDLIARWRRLRSEAKPTERIENSTIAPNLSELESELE